MQDLEFSEIVDLICKEDKRFGKRAYFFVRQALDHTFKEIRSADANRMRHSSHVTGAELLDGIRSFALDQFGPMAKMVLNDWGIKRCGDFGDIVFNLIESRVFSKTEEDRREDFEEIFDFEEAFVKPFLPGKRQLPDTPPEAVSAS